jgi:hypothetical protein
MPDLELSDIPLGHRDIGAVIPIETKALRRDLWMSLVAAFGVILVIGGGLLALTVELRSGWVSNHEVQMDKAAAVHKLLFRH